MYIFGWLFFLTERIWLILHDDMGIWNQQQQHLKQHNNDNNQLFDINVYQHVISKKKINDLSSKM
jgi:hypothetical protein